MPTIIGIPAGKMIRTSAISDTDVLGLTRLTETYAFATSEFQTFRARLINLTPYNTVMNYVYPTSSTSYPYVVIESASITEDVGGISQATVQYQGILKSTTANAGDISWLPPAKQRIESSIGTGPNYILVIVDFVYFSDSLTTDLDILKKYGDGTLLPISINGTNLYRSPVAPYIKESEPAPFQIAAQGASLPAPESNFEQYYGMLCISHFAQKSGLFYRITNTYQDSVRGRSAGISYNWGTNPRT